MIVTSDAGIDRPDARSAERTRGRSEDRTRKVRASLWGVSIAAIPFLLVLWNFGLRPLRSALPNRLFSDFFDIQARALLDGDLAVPAGALGFEAFLHDDAEYMYFGAWPSLLRLPVLRATDNLDGRLSAPSMLIAWIVAATFTSMLVWRIRAIVAPRRVLTRLELVLAGGLIALVLGASPVLSLAALPWVYSEALLWSIAAALGALFAIVGVLERTSARRIAVAGAMTLVAVLCRVTAGWGCGLAVLGVSVLFALMPRFAERRRWVGWIAAAGAIPLGVGIAINYAKFGHPILIPFESQIWTDLSERRQATLDQGGVTGVRFLPATLYNYLRPDGIRFSPIFPFITSPAHPAAQVGGTVIEMPYRTPSVTALMPLLVVAGSVGIVQIFKRGASVGAALLRVPMLGALSILGGILFVGYIAPRYTAEFVPVLLIAATAGMYAILERAPSWSSPVRAGVAAGACVLAVLGALANLAIATSAARVAEGGRSLAALVALQSEVSDRTGRPLDRWVVVGDELPATSEPDRIFILGECDSMFVGSGDLFDPWVPIEMRPVRIDVELGDRPSPGRAVLARFGPGGDREVALEAKDYMYRLVVTGAAGGYREGPWRPFIPGTSVSINVSEDFANGVFIVDSSSNLYASLYAVEYGQDAVARMLTLDASMTDADRRLLDLSVLVSKGPVSELCRDLRNSRT